MSQILQSSPATIALMLFILLAGLYALYRKKEFAKLLLHPYSVVRHKEYYRILTADFVHTDIVHLLLNEVMLYFFGSALEAALRKVSADGSLKFLIIFLVSQLTGNIIISLKYRNDFDYTGTGCSGSVMGCLFAFILIDPRGTAFSYFLIGNLPNIYTGLIFILLIIFYKWRQGNDVVNHELHFYGALGGIAGALLVCRPFY